MTTPQETEKFNPPFKRLNQSELLSCLEHGWTGRVTFVKAAVPPQQSGKYTRMAYNMLGRKSAFVSAMVFPSVGTVYRMVDFSVIAGLEKKGLVTVTYFSDCEAVFQLSKEA